MKTPPIEKARRGRPDAARVRAIDAAILAIACEMFISDGYDAVTMEHVASAARISKSTLYSRYNSKEVLFTAVINDLIQQWSREASQQNYMLTDDIERRLRHHARTIARSLRRPDVIAVQQIVMGLGARFPELARVLRDRGYRYITGLIERDLWAAASREGWTLRDPGAVARMLVGALSGVFTQERDLLGDKEADAFVERLVDVLMAGRDAW